MRTIDADAALKALRKCQTYLYDARDPELKIELSSAEAAINNLPTIQPEKAQLFKEGTTSDLISKFIDGLEEIFADLRERHVDDSVCGLCEYDGAYIGESGDWCNECPGFERDDCFKLSDKTRKEWTDEIINALPTVQPQSTTGQLNDGARSTAQSTNLIERQAAIDAANDWYEGLICGSINGLIKRLNALPTIQPEPQEGHWINGKCDLCGEHALFWCMASTYHESNYCPNCGAKMTISTK